MTKKWKKIASQGNDCDDKIDYCVKSLFLDYFMPRQWNLVVFGELIVGIIPTIQQGIPHTGILTTIFLTGWIDEAVCFIVQHESDK